MGNTLFKKLSAAQIFESSKYFRPGRYIVKIKDVKFIDGHRGESFVIETKVLAAVSSAEDAPEVGDTAAHVWKVSGDKKQVGLGTWMQFMCAVLGMNQDDQTDDEWETISNDVIDNNAFEDIDMLLECHNIVTQAGDNFTKHTWIGQATDETKEEFGPV